MKKLLLAFILAFSFSLTSKGQSISVVYQSPDTVQGENFEDITSYIHFRNIAGNANNYLAEQIKLDLVTGHDAYFCWGVDCYPTSVLVATDTVDLMPNQIDSTFIGYLTPYALGPAVDGISTMKYRIWNITDTADKFEKIIVYVAGNVSSLSHSKINGGDVYVYPNPASTSLKLVYGDVEAESGRVIIRNVLGSSVMSKDIDLKSNMTELDLTDLPNGIYLYTLEIEGSAAVTKKFTVRK